MSHLSRRHFLAASSVAGAALAAGKAFAQPEKPKVSGPGDGHKGGPMCIASMNGLRATVRAMELLNDGYDPADAIVQGVKIIEDDPNDTSVGLGGEPNFDGVVELDASVMHGPTHKTGAVASIRNIKNPAHVALTVLRRTDHCLLVGEGALRFAKMHGFKEEDLLTEESRRNWLKWRENMSDIDAYLSDSQRDAAVGKTWDKLPSESKDEKHAAAAWPYPGTTGTVHCSALTAKGDIASCTSTSGLSWKIPGRVGDSPIIGAGNYCDNKIGAAGSTGRGEANIVNLAAFKIVDMMGNGMTPTEACAEMCKRIADHTKEKRLLGPDGKPNFDLKFYALRKDGAYGGASLYGPDVKFAVHDGKEAKLIDAAFLYERKKVDVTK